MSIKALFLILFCSLLLACNQADTINESNDQKQTTVFHGHIENQHGIKVPVVLHLRGDSAFVINGSEVIALKTVATADSLKLVFPIYLSELVLTRKQDQLIGRWHRPGEDYSLSAAFVKRDEVSSVNAMSKANFDLSGRWETNLRIEENPYQAIGEFKQNGAQVSGTIIAQSGDWRYLNGWAKGDSFYLSAFDGAILYYFTGRVQGDSIGGNYYSGKSTTYSWNAKRNAEFELTDKKTVVGIVPNIEVAFSAITIEGDSVKYPSPRFQNKAMIIQITGSWCPNCKDEGKVLVDLYRKYHDQGLEIVAYSFERSDSLKKELNKIKSYKHFVGADYPFLFGGKATKDNVLRQLPFLADLKAYPTTIYIDTKGTIREVHTGFRGPSTSDYARVTAEMDSLVAALLP